MIKRRGRNGVRVMLGKCWWVGRNLIVFQDAVLASGGEDTSARTVSWDKMTRRGGGHLGAWGYAGWAPAWKGYSCS